MDCTTKPKQAQKPNKTTKIASSVHLTWMRVADATKDSRRSVERSIREHRDERAVKIACKS
jgi:hypothetical protein